MYRSSQVYHYNCVCIVWVTHHFLWSFKSLLIRGDLCPGSPTEEKHGEENDGDEQVVLISLAVIGRIGRLQIDGLSVQRVQLGAEVLQHSNLYNPNHMCKSRSIQQEQWRQKPNCTFPKVFGGRDKAEKRLSANRWWTFLQIGTLKPPCVLTMAAAGGSFKKWYCNRRTNKMHCHFVSLHPFSSAVCSCELISVWEGLRFFSMIE